MGMDDPEALVAAGTDFVILSRDPADNIGASPAVLPILPLKDTVVFPDTMTPLAVGQPRSVSLIDDILRGDKQVGLVASKRPDIEVPGPDDVNTIGVLATIQKMIKAPDGTLRIIAQGIRRIQIERFVAEEPYLTARVQRPARRRGAGHRTGGAAAQPDRRLHAHRPVGPLPARRTGAGGGQHRRPRGPRLLHRLHHAPQDGGQAGTARRGRPFQAAAPPHHLHEPGAGSAGAGLQDPGPGPVGDGQDPARVRPAPAAQGHPGRAGRDGRDPGRGQRAAATASTKAHLPEEVDKQAGRELDRLSKLPPRPPSTASSAPTSTGSSRCPGRSSPPTIWTWPHARQVLDEDHYDLEDVKDRILEFLAVQKLEGRGHQPHPLLRRTSRRGQDQPGQEHRPGHGAQVHPHQRGRGARRVRDPRASAHLRGRHARHHHPRHPRRGQQQPGVHDRRDRQDGLRLAGRSLQRHAGGARPGAAQHLPRPLSRPAVRPLPGDVHLHGQRARHHPRPAARPDGDHLHRRLHRAGQDAHRPAVPGAPAAGAQRPQARPARRSPIGALTAIIENYTREAGRPRPGAADRHHRPQVRAHGGRGGPRTDDRGREAGGQVLGPAEGVPRDQAAHQRSRCVHRPGLDARRAATSSSSRRGPCRATGSWCSPANSAT